MNLAGGYESLCYPYIKELIEAIPGDVDITVYTSGVADIMKDENFLELLVSRVKQVRFSVNAITMEIYRQVQFSGKVIAEKYFSFVINTIVKCLKIRDDLISRGKPAARIGISYLIINRNIDQLPEAYRFWNEKGVDFIDVGNDFLTRDPVLLERLKTIEGKLKTGRTKLHTNRTKFRSGLIQSPKCYSPVNKIFLNPYGKLTRCCVSCQPGYDIPAHQLGIATSGEEFLLAMNEINKQGFVLNCSCEYCSENDFTYNSLLHQAINNGNVGT